jgi:hypothetical protein
MKTARNTLVAVVFVIILLWIINEVIGLLQMKDDEVSALGGMLSGITAAIGVFYAILQYRSYQDSRKTELLCTYNQRYAADKSIEKVIKWILKTAKLDENGKIVGKDPNTVLGVEIPDIYDKEMFMRFFEELNVQINKGLLQKEDTLRLFAAYALIFDEYSSFREDITDYDDRTVWSNYHDFIEKNKKPQGCPCLKKFNMKGIIPLVFRYKHNKL